jgi:hypothetical protein
LDSFQGAVDVMMKIRQEINRLGSAIYCHRNMAHAAVTAQAIMPQAIQVLPLAQRRVLMQWLTMHGPYWEDARLHNSDDWLEVNGAVVTDSAIGEVAVSRLLHGLPRELVSFVPSDWGYGPIDVNWMYGETPDHKIAVPNHWEFQTVKACLEANPARPISWDALEAYLRNACARLSIADDAFEPLRGHPFAPGAAERIQALLFVLDKFKGCFDIERRRTPEGQKLYNDYFTGEKAWFSDSSDTEKDEFRNDLTFRHPAKAKETLLCTWHGKVKTPQIRIHFSWPILADVPLYLVYVGPKITKR